ncbi:MAG: hypothetical protein ACLT8E_04305 [Akkermansia sp.]
MSAGFGSLRRFNELFKKEYRLRRHCGSWGGERGGGFRNNADVALPSSLLVGEAA